ncbi:MAG: PPC domain-containing DNA-binding protein [Bacillota bacterium]
MEYKCFSDTVIARFDRGDEVIASLAALCEREQIELGSVNAIGAVGEATLGCFDTNEKKYYAKDYKGIYEIASLMGTVSVQNDKPYLHIHAVLADMEGTAIGGHLSRAVVSATCEIVIRTLPGRAGRFFSEETGLNLISLND